MLKSLKIKYLKFWRL